MLSIAIPVYNQDVRSLVSQLSEQGRRLTIPFEILCFDDGSTSDFRTFNGTIRSIAYVRYEEMGVNAGRSRIRNILGNACRYPYILFLDGDSALVHDALLKCYTDRLPTSSVLYGGRVYSSASPTSDKRLHWTYGSTRETRPASRRQQEPYLNFQSNNFLIPTGTFQTIQFNEDIQGYGYEDNHYAEQLRHRHISIEHIENPVLHDGLETNTVFIQKTRRAIANLCCLYRTGALSTTRLIHLYERLRRLRLLTLTDVLLQATNRWLESNLHSGSPSMILFSLWKLKLFIAEEKRTKSG